jgi:hypothetical protein
MRADVQKNNSELPSPIQTVCLGRTEAHPLAGLETRYQITKNWALLLARTDRANRRKFSFRHGCQERAFGWCHPVST